MVSKGLPKYLFLKRELMRRIRSAGPGERIDSEHELVAKYSVSRATVSKAIGELEAEGYVYREQGRGTFVAQSKARTDGALAFIYYSWKGGIGAGSFFGHILAGGEEAARGSGRDILFMAGKTRPGEEFQPPSPAELARKAVAGLLCVGVDSDDHLAALISAGLPLVSVDYQSDRLDMDSVVGGTESGGYAGTKLLLGKGHRRVAFLGAARRGSRAYQAPDQGSLERLAGFRRAHREAGVEVDEELVMQPMQEEISFTARMARLGEAGRLPTAIFSSVLGEELTRILAAAREKGRPIEAVAADSLPVASPWGEPELRVCEDPAEMGRTAARMLMERVAGQAGPARRVAVSSKLMRASAGDVRPVE